MGDETVGARGVRNARRRVALVSRLGLAAAETDGNRDATPVRADYVPVALLAIAALGALWAAIAAPHGAWGLAILVGTTVLLDVLAGDVLRAGRRIVAPGLAIGVAAFVL